MLKKIIILGALLTTVSSFASNDLFNTSKSSIIEKESIFKSDNLSVKKGPLEVTQAFQPDYILGSDKFEVTFNVQNGYYIYKDKIKLKVNGDQYNVDKPASIRKNDPVYGNVEVYEGYTSFKTIINSKESKLDITLEYQGCSEEYKICYPVEITKSTLTNIYNNNPENLTYIQNKDLSEKSSSKEPIISKTTVFDNMSDANFISKFIKTENYAVTLGVFLLFGILMAFTPCIFPMIPILSGIIVKHDKKHPLMLSSLYVLGIALCYASIGLILKLMNFNIQIALQNTYLLIATAIVMFILSLSMFGFINPRMPTFLQGKIHEKVETVDKSKNPLSLILSGYLSALILSPCAVAPLAGTLLFASQYDSIIYSTFLLFVLGIGSGIPLIIWGSSFKKILPKAGMWMYEVKNFIGITLILIGLYLISKIIPINDGSLTSAAFKTVCISVFIGYLLKFLDTKIKNKIILFLVSFILLFNINTNQPSNNNVINAKDSFIKVNSISDITPTSKSLVYVGADWCVSCKEMEHTTFKDPKVIDELKNYKVYFVDITELNDNKKEILKKYDLQIAPFYVLYDKDGKQKEEINIGYIDKNKFLEIIQK